MSLAAAIQGLHTSLSLHINSTVASLGLAQHRSTVESILPYWLLVVAFARVFSVFTGYIRPQTFSDTVFTKGNVTPLHGRTFAIWTSLTCILCLLTVGDMSNRGVFLATFASFAVAAIHFATEWLIYRTMDFAGFIKPAPFAIGSMLLMLLAWP